MKGIKLTFLYLVIFLLNFLLFLDYITPIIHPDTKLIPYARLFSLPPRWGRLMNNTVDKNIHKKNKLIIVLLFVVQYYFNLSQISFIHPLFYLQSLLKLCYCSLYRLWTFVRPSLRLLHFNYRHWFIQWLRSQLLRELRP